jgi:ADP-heptose:LPS heptosyltransferase
VTAVGGRVDGVERILVLRANALGDYVMTLPALAAVRVAYPRAEVVLAGKRWHAAFLAGRPGPVDRVEVLPEIPGLTVPAGPDGGSAAGDPAADASTHDGRYGGGEIREVVARLRAERFDLALQLHGGGRYSNPFVSSLGARVTAGLRAPGAPPLDRVVPHVYYQSEVFRMLEVAALVGAAPVRHEPVLEPTPADQAEVCRVLGTGADARLAALHPGATDPRRRWPADRFAAVGDALAARGATVVVTGTADEAGIVAEVVAAMHRPATPLVGTLSIGGLVGLYARSAVVVSNDTGPLHVAQAVGARTVGVYWCGNLVNAGPATRTRHRPQLSWTLHCPECGADCTRDLYPARAGGPACAHPVSFVADVPVVEVRDAALELYEEAADTTPGGMSSAASSGRGSGSPYSGGRSSYT